MFSGLGLRKGFYLFTRPETVEQAVKREALLVREDPILSGSGTRPLRYTRLGHRAGIRAAEGGERQGDGDDEYAVTVGSGWHFWKFEKADSSGGPSPSPWAAAGGSSAALAAAAAAAADAAAASDAAAGRVAVAGRWGQRSGAAVLAQSLGGEVGDSQKKEDNKDDEEEEDDEEEASIVGADLPLQLIGMPDVGEKSPFLVSSAQTGRDILRCLASLPLPIKGFEKNPLVCRMPVWELNVGVGCLISLTAIKVLQLIIVSRQNHAGATLPSRLQSPVRVCPVMVLCQGHLEDV